jgi:hypothetical protein
MPRGYDAFPAPYFRRTLTHRDARLAPHTLVLALHVASQPSGPVTAGSAGQNVYRAYPLNALRASYGALNDTVENVPVGVLFESGPDTAIAVSRELDGSVLTLQPRRFGRGYAVFDRETGTRWNIEGRGVAGPLAGRQLHRMDSTMSEWYGWSAYFPRTSIYGQPVASGSADVPAAGRSAALTLR